MLLHGQGKRVEELRRQDGGDGLEGVLSGLRELHWRTRAILGAADPGPADAALSALLELAGLHGPAPRRRQGGRGQARRRHLDEVEGNAASLAALARQCVERFPASEFGDEFRLCAEAAAEQAAAARQMRQPAAKGRKTAA